MEMDEVRVPPAGLSGTDPLAPGLVIAGRRALHAIPAPQEVQGLPGQQPFVDAPGQVHGAAVVPAVGRLQRTAALDGEVAGREQFEQGHQPRLQQKAADDGGTGNHDLDVGARARPQRQHLSVPKPDRQVGLQMSGDMGDDRPGSLNAAIRSVRHGVS